MTDKFFPIKKDPACKLKWTWSTIWFHDGTTSSCHRCSRHSIDPDNFDAFHNTPQKIAQREKMLAGEWPDDIGCNYCRRIEEAGGRSDRQFQLKIPNQIPKELDTDPTAVKTTPRILELFLSNTCNMRCIYCRPTNSSRIQREVEKFGHFSLGDIYNKSSERRGETKPVETIDKLVKGFWKWLNYNYQDLERLHLLGGEPYLQEEFRPIADFWDTHPNPNLEINVISNLSIDKKIFRDYMTQFKRYVDEGKIKRFDLTASIDCWGPEQEYIRSGIDLALFEENMNWLLDQEEYWLRININQTITGLGIRSMPLLFNKLAEWRTKRSVIGHYGQDVFGLPFLNASIWPEGYWDATFDEILASLPQSNWDEQEAHSSMTGLLNEIRGKTKFNPELFRQLITYLTELDERRNTNWRDAFPDVVRIEQEYL